VDVAAEGPRTPSASEHQFEQDVARKAARRQRAQREGDRSIWFSLGLFGVVGWSVAIPTLLGLALGIWIDARWPGRVSWALTLLFVGAVLGAANAWYWVKQEIRDDQP
jgi:ATP synthase protein I